MHRARFMKHMRTLLVMVMAVAFVIAPVSAAADALHPDEAEADICLDAESGQDGPEDTSPEGHDHTVHQCGSCHIHIMSSDACSPLTFSTLGKQVLRGERVYATRGSDGLYRPPRA
ncbi:DUF2946 family protein [Henriciella aquimarina]|uniref:DUF2946 family protein n=1 Tax=Henriciella aquimarina TaxID=545261 RepID=UPI0009FF9667|nr:DUF2946 family protein [Henriciella aquimarina]